MFRTLTDSLRVLGGLAAFALVTAGPLALTSNALPGIVLGAICLAALPALAVSRPPVISSAIVLSVAVLVVGLIGTVLTEQPGPSIAGAWRETRTWLRAAALLLAILIPPMVAIRTVGATRPSRRSVFGTSLISVGVGAFFGFIVLTQSEGLDMLVIVGPLFTGLLAMTAGLFLMAAWRARRRLGRDG
ncbi:MAG: hypothetical protein QN122_07905 [Armatimonadota bacterium]|nr:hypothetical protein [Armatimonadota bacterium]MDR7448409.1 hypothetical protein [Armatimonadota bacterium]MDR7480333.1 hypothetical protein [Armatimonadota bacterium]MDR7488320.1 hypothetical protein [Armatimonadota bacterium]MDR7491360.1 hypothetical protein [Armatimonadota bacterium]